MIERVEFVTNPSCPNVVTHTKEYPPFEISDIINQEKEVAVKLFFKSDSSFPTTLGLPVKVDSSKSGYICNGIEVSVEMPGTKDKKIAEIAKWLEHDRMDDSSPILSQDVKQEPMQTIFVHNTTISNSNTLQLGSSALWKTSSAPASPLSQVTTPVDNNRTRSASSSPTARSQTVLPNPCCRIQNSSYKCDSNDNLPSVRCTVDGEPTYKRRPGPISLIHNSPKFTPISVADSPTILHTTNSIPIERGQADQINTIGIEQLPTITLTEQPNPPQIYLTSQSISPKVSQVRIINDAVPIHSTSLKTEFFVRPNEIDSNSEITVGAPTQAITQSDNDHLRNQRSGRKCRKVYGVSNRTMWCTACRWKKACRRFPS